MFSSSMLQSLGWNVLKFGRQISLISQRRCHDQSAPPFQQAGDDIPVPGTTSIL